MTNDQWYYARNGERIGPVALDGLRAMASSGALKPQDLVWHESMTQWSPAGNISDLFSAPNQPPQAAPYVAVPLGYAGPAPINYYTPPQQSVIYAGFWLRFVAIILDTILLAIVNGTIGFIFGFALGYMMAHAGSTQADIRSTAAVTGNILGVTLVWLYNAFMESSTAQGSLGKMALGLKVTDMAGQRISFARATGRHFGQFLSGLILMIGFLMAGFTEKKQALHDLMANCLVVKK